MPVFALLRAVQTVTKDDQVVVIAQGSGDVVNCGNAGLCSLNNELCRPKKGNLSDNEKIMVSSALNCEGIAPYAQRNLSELCSESAYEVVSYKRWMLLWSATVNANNNWHRDRFLARPAQAGRSEHAVAMLYRQLAAQLRSQLQSTTGRPEPQGSSIVTFANRLEKRRAVNMQDLISNASHQLGRNHVRPLALYFENITVRQAAAALSRTRVFVSPHGAGTANILLLPPAATLIELMPYRCQR